MATLLELKMRKMELRDKMDEERKTDGGISIETGTEYGQVIDRLQEGECKLLKCLVWPALVLLLLFSDGCGKTMRGTGLIFEGFGDAIVAGGQYLQESADEK